MVQFSQDCKDFGLTISLKKTKSCPPHNSYVDKSQADIENKDVSLQHLCHQRDMNNEIS